VNIPSEIRTNEIAIRPPFVDDALLRLALYPACRSALDVALVAVTEASNTVIVFRTAREGRK
jgi:hypothetical protein